MIERVGIIGYGSIAQDLASILAEHAPGAHIVVLARLGRENTAREALGAAGLVDNLQVTGQLDRFLDEGLDVVAECAGHGAVADYCEPILANGTDLVVASVGNILVCQFFGGLVLAIEQ